MPINPDLLILFAGAVVFAAAICVRFPLAPVIAAVPASFLVLHIGGAGGGNSISLADAFLIFAALSAIPLVRWRQATPLIRWLPLVLFYQATTLLSVVSSPNRYDVVEWIHQLVMVGGAAMVGYAITIRGRELVSLQIYAICALPISLWVLAVWIGHGLHPIAGLSGGLQKNTVGVLLVVAVLICQFANPWPHRKALAAATKYLCLVGVLATGSRQAIIGLIVAATFTLVRDRPNHVGAPHRIRQRTIVMAVILFILGVIAYVSVSQEANSTAKITSITTREASYSQTLDIWRTSPVFGVGERYWYTSNYPSAIQPPNAEVAILATGGIVGLVGLIVLLGGSLRLVWRIPPGFGSSLGLSVLLAHIVEGQFDIFWVTATGSLPWIIFGMTLAHSRQPQSTLEPSLPSHQ